jgi:hypothetical protein
MTVGPEREHDREHETAVGGSPPDGKRPVP